jgi:hypothetical protein
MRETGQVASYETRRHRLDLIDTLGGEPPEKPPQPILNDVRAATTTVVFDKPEVLGDVRIL